MKAVASAGSLRGDEALHSIHHLWDVPKFVVGFLNPTEWQAFRGSLLDWCLFVLLLYTLSVLWRLDAWRLLGPTCWGFCRP